MPDSQKHGTNRAGIEVQRALLAAIAWTTLLAFLSLGQQVDVLIGERGLLPVRELAELLSARDDLSLPRFPTLFRWFYSDFAIKFFVFLGASFALLAGFGKQPRLMLGLCIPLYLSFVIGCRDFLAFQWDNMLLECLALAVFLPRRRRAPAVLFAIRVLLFKLYFESGIAKWQSYLGDWHDGSAMMSYYETAPIAGLLGWWAHNLPAGWHHFESWAAIGLELVLPWFIFGTRWMRLTALVGFTGFQIINLATANYGFFVHLSLVLHLVLLDDADMERARQWVHRLARRVIRGWPRFDPTLHTATSPRELPAQRISDGKRRLLTALAVPLLTLYVGHSIVLATTHFTHAPGTCHPKRLRCTERSKTVQRWLDASESWRSVLDEARLIHAYHLFGHITTERIEPEFEVDDGRGWQALAMRYKAGPPGESPQFIAPHQPRVDFRLWFYGLGFRRGMPQYVRVLLQRICTDSDAVQPLFKARLPAAPRAVRIRFWRYEFTTPEQFAEGGDYWQRTELGSTRPLQCSEHRDASP